MTIEQMVRDILEAHGIPDAQSLSAGDVAEASNVLSKHWLHENRPVAPVPERPPAEHPISVLQYVIRIMENESGRHDQTIESTLYGYRDLLTMVLNGLTSTARPCTQGTSVPLDAGLYDTPAARN